MAVSASDQLVPETAVAALEQGRVIEAIKIVRAVHGLGLKESKDAVDGYLRNNPEVRQRLSETSSEATHKLGLWVGLFVGVGIVVWFMLR
jgi:ribosomal protein L7/L12